MVFIFFVFPEKKIKANNHILRSWYKNKLKKNNNKEGGGSLQEQELGV